MTLHEAIVRLLMESKGSMTTSEIASRLNKNKWYTKKKKDSLITPFQVHGRTKNYHQLFNRDGSTVSLKGQSSKNIPVKKEEIKKVVSKKSTPPTTKAIPDEKMLMNERKFKSASSIDSIVPHDPGIYCVRISDIRALPKAFRSVLEERKHNIIYIGVATGSLNSRFINQELRANGHGTFFRSIGAVLGFRPTRGSLKDKANKRNYKFSSPDEVKIIKWINENLKVNWITYNGNIHTFETELIQKYRPLLNLAKNPSPLTILSDIRAECVKIAND